jgi:hypothetical protein
MLGHVCFEFLLVGCLGGGIIIWHDWVCDVFEGEELVSIQRVYNRFFKGH